MKRLLMSSLLLLCAFGLTAQMNNLKSYNALSARVLAIDHQSINDGIDEASPTFALEVGFRRQFSKIFGIMVPIKVGIIDVGELDNITISGIEVLGQLYPAGTDGKISPYLHAGYGVVSERLENANRQIPLGVGLNFRLDGNSWFNIQGEYRISDQENRDNIMAGIGYVYRLSSIDSDKDGIINRDDKCPDLPGPLATNGCPDADMDGVTDDKDRCPTEAGNANLAGCPDTDQDGTPNVDDKCPELAGPADKMGCPDADGDGINDEADECPELAGKAELDGCPDTDGDGVKDSEDECPNTAGNPRLKGCPDADGDGIPDKDDKCPDLAGESDSGCPDKDGDGVSDDEDKCPGIAGTFNGCPDTDGDGVGDDLDRCPTQAGTADNAGCPEIKQEVKERLEYAARAVRFETGSDKLKEESYIVLSEVAGIMRQYPDYDLTISGHTDNVGSDVTNLALSERRAAACLKFIVATGIKEGRISSAGYGESRPVADNGTASGRRINRRVEFGLNPRR
ncbi:OmpA family protein [Neolewinella aurantiaca]|uniref:OmpA family protein n=1 Tax=Neolewinella aurantiaca TaxID=2602767 RepID=A0A5C7FRW8_9BACT|nr:OmpA family protein [Neolewinella aurantiaca]TXF88886.1 OmpA family protein [Neolewinella aurantiaca]